MLRAQARQIRTGKWLSTVRTRTITVLYFRYNQQQQYLFAIGGWKPEGH